MKEKKLQNKLFTLQQRIFWTVFVVLSVLFFYNYLKLGYVNNDQQHFMARTFLERLQKNYEWTILWQARPDFLGLLAMVTEYTSFIPYWFWAVSYAISTGLCAAFAVDIITENLGLTKIAFLMTCFFTTITLEPFDTPVGYALNFGLGFVTCILAVCYTLLYNKTGSTKYKVYSLLNFFASVLCYEAGVMLLPAMIGINCCYVGSLSIPENWKKSKEYILAGILYVAIYFGVKIFIGTGTYQGTTFDGGFSIWVVLITLLNVLKTCIPGYYFFDTSSVSYAAPWTKLNDFGHSVCSLSYWVKNHFSVSLLLQIGCFGLLVFMCAAEYKKNVAKNGGDTLTGSLKADKQLIAETAETKPENTKPNTFFHKVLPALLMLYCIIAPTLPSCLTPQTQRLVAEHKWGTVMGKHYSTLILFVVVLIMFDSLYRKGKLNNVVSGILCGVLVIQFGLVGYTNEKNGQVIEDYRSRFVQMQAMAEDLSATVPDGSYIVSPSLFKSSPPFGGVLFVSQDVFGRIIERETGAKITFTASVVSVPQNAERNIYYMRYLFSEDYTQSSYTLAKVTYDELYEYEGLINWNQEVELKSEDVKVYCFSDDASAQLIGRVTDEKTEPLQITNGSNRNTIETRDIFTYAFEQNWINSGKPVVLSLAGRTVDANSLGLIPNYITLGKGQENIQLGTYVGSTLNSSQIVYGCTKDWQVNAMAAFRMATLSSGKVQVSVRVPAGNQNLSNQKIRVLQGGEELGVISIEKNGKGSAVVDTGLPNTKIVLELISDYKTPDKEKKSCYIIEELNAIP